MIEDLQLRGLSERTQEMSVRAVRQLADYYHKAPAQTTAEELRDYVLSLKMSNTTPARPVPSRCAGSRSSLRRPSNGNGPR